MVSELLIFIIIGVAKDIVLQITKAVTSQKDYVEKLIDANQSIAVNRVYQK